MKKGIKIFLIVLGVIIILGLIFFGVDYNRVKNGDNPIFCIRNLAGIIMDGGTIEYFGLGYKVIDFNMLNGYDEIKIGSWFMKYEDFENEYNNYTEETVWIQVQTVSRASSSEASAHGRHTENFALRSSPAAKALLLSYHPADG